MNGLITSTYEEPKKNTGLQNTIGNPAAASTLQNVPNANPNSAPVVQPLVNNAASSANNVAAQAAPNAIQMEYTDPNGNPAIGYSINNRMYKDAAGTQRVDEGSIVTNKSQTQAWIMHNGAGVPIANYQPGANAAITNAYGSAVQAANQRMEANIAQIEANRPKINDAYNQLQQQNYQGYMQSQKALANQLESQGLYNSGYSDTAKVAQNVGYRSAQSETERARLQALADLETEINIARMNGSANLSELEAEYAILQNEQANYEREFAYKIAQDLMDRAYRKDRDAVEDEWRNKEWGYMVQRDQVEDERYEDQVARDEAWKRAEYGDFAGLEEIGIDPTIYQEAFDKAEQRKDEEWAMIVEEHAAQMKQFESAEEQRLYNIAFEQAKHGNFKPLQDLGYDTTGMEAEYARLNELSDLEVQAAYQDIALGEQQKQINAKKLSEMENDESQASETDYDALYNKNPKLFEDIMSSAKTWVTNNANSSQSEFDEQYKIAYNVALKTYGQEYADLWASTVAQEWSAMMHAEPEPENYTVTHNDAVTRVEEVLYSGPDGARTTDPVALSNLIKELNDMNISNEDLERILSAYGLWDVWENMFQ